MNVRAGFRCAAVRSRISADFLFLALVILSPPHYCLNIFYMYAVLYVRQCYSPLIDERCHHMKNSSAVVLRTANVAIMTGLLAGFFALPANAGFEWTPPPPAPAIAPMSMPEVPAAPAASVEAVELTPVPVSSEPEMSAMEAPAGVEDIPAPMADVSDIAATPSIEKENTELPASPFSETLDAPGGINGGSYADAMGFGSDIPLALALGQIVPPSFAYSFASNVNPGLKISWNGGKPWDQALNESLNPLGLRADIVGSAVIVRNMSSSTSAAPEETQMPDQTPSDVSAQSQEAMMIEQAVVPETAAQQISLRGEGTAEHYPRRSPPKTSFRSSIFTPDEQKGNSAPPPPAMEDDHAVIIENEVQNSVMPARDADVAAAFEPAAPAAAAMPQPTPLIAQRISYADETMADHSDRLVSEKPAVENNSHKTLDPFEVSFWRAEAGENLQEVLNSWAETAGVEVLWDSGYNYKLPTAISLHGTFPDAVSKVFSLYGKTEPRPQGRLHPNLPKGPSVLLVENYP